MRQNYAAQPIKLDERERAETPVVSEAELKAENSNHESKMVVSIWVREHEHRSEEFARAFKDLLTEEGFISSRTGEGAGK
jgi:predicted lipoprotein